MGTFGAQTMSVRPRVGGVLPPAGGAGPASYWVGGSALPDKRLTAPVFVDQRRPTDYKSKKKAQEDATTGLKDILKLGKPGDKDSCSLVKWKAAVKHHCEQHGLDTVFRMMFEDNTEGYMFDDLRLCQDHDTVKSWVEELQTGVGREQAETAEERESIKPCKFDMENLLWSGKFILNSVTESMWTVITHQHGINVTGPMAFAAAVKKHQQMTPNALRKLEDELKALKLKNEPGLNVANFRIKVGDKAELIHQLKGEDPGDLSLLVSSCFTDVDVKMFSRLVEDTYNLLDENPAAMTYIDVLDKFSAKYDSLVSYGKWVNQPAANALQTQLNKLEARIPSQSNSSGGGGNSNSNNRGGGNSNSSGKKKKKTCWDCGSENHLRGDPDCPKKGTSTGDGSSNNNNNNNGHIVQDLKKKPGERDPKKGKHNNKDVWWCDHCNRWTYSHSTSKHKTDEVLKAEREEKKKKAQGNLNVVKDKPRQLSANKVQAATEFVSKLELAPIEDPSEAVDDVKNVEPTGHLTILGAFPMMPATVDDDDTISECSHHFDKSHHNNGGWFDHSDEEEDLEKGEVIDEEKKKVTWDPDVKDNEDVGGRNRAMKSILKNPLN